ncbi:hypothetical protein [Haladaptatus sp. NG-SE-30]
MVDLLLVSPRETAGGIGKYSATLREAISKESVAVDTLDLSEDADLFQQLRNTICSGMTSAKIVHVQFEYAYFRPYLLFAWIFFPIVGIFLRIRGRNLVITMHEVWNEKTFGGSLGRVKIAYVQLVHWMFSIVAHELVFLSTNANKAFDVPQKSATERILSHGVDLEGRKDIKQQESRKQFDLSPDATVVSQIGYVAPRKNTETILSLAKEFPEHEFLIAGGPLRPEDEPYFRHIVEKGTENVTITGILSDDDFHAAFVASDVAVLAYTDIRQSGILNWCFAYGTPMLCRKIPYFERLANQWGGIELFNSNQEAANSLGSLLADRGQYISEMETYRNENSLEKLAKRHVNLYSSLLTNQRLY